VLESFVRALNGGAIPNCPTGGKIAAKLLGSAPKKEAA
jgi:hypothetical protein